MSETIHLPFPEVDEEASGLRTEYKSLVDRQQKAQHDVNEHEAAYDGLRARLSSKLRRKLGLQATRDETHHFVYWASASEELIKSRFNASSSRARAHSHYEQHSAEYYDNAKAEAEADGKEIRTE